MAFEATTKTGEYRVFVPLHDTSLSALRGKPVQLVAEEWHLDVANAKAKASVPHVLVVKH